MNTKQQSTKKHRQDDTEAQQKGQGNYLFLLDLHALCGFLSHEIFMRLIM